MLKVKDNINLSVLEKYGFRRIDEFGDNNFTWSYVIDNNSAIVIDEKSRLIGIETFGLQSKILDILFNLFQDKIIEEAKDNVNLKIKDNKNL